MFYVTRKTNCTRAYAPDVSELTVDVKHPMVNIKLLKGIATEWGTL